MDDTVLGCNKIKNGVVVLRTCTKVKLIAVGFAMLCVLGYILFQSDLVQKKLFYPYQYRELVTEYAELRELNPALVAGVILGESKFKIEAKSHKGAMGLMQLMPETAEWIAGQIELEDFVVEDLMDPETNIRFGTWYLSSLRHEFQGNEILMLAAYNAGRGNVKKWMEKYHWNMDFSDIEEIPYKETREYVIKVIKNKEKYQQLYME